MALTAYERYQLEWMIEHGHSLGELMSRMSILQWDYEVAPDYNKTVGELFDIWRRDSGFGGEIFASEAEWRGQDSHIKAELAMNNGAYYNPETGDLIVSYLVDYEDPAIEVFSAKTYELYHAVSQLTPDDIDFGETTHELAGQFAHHVATYLSVDELASAGYFDKGKLLDVSSTGKLFKVGLAIARAESSDIDLLVKRNIEEGRTVYAPDSGIAIASYLDDAEDPRIEVSHYTPYELASLVNARMEPDAADIRDVLNDPSRPRACGHETATFGSIDDFLARMGSPTSISQKWLPMSGSRLEPSMEILREMASTGRESGTVVTVDGKDYPLMKGATFEDSRRVDALLDSHGDLPLSRYAKPGRDGGCDLDRESHDARDASGLTAAGMQRHDEPAR